MDILQLVFTASVLVALFSGAVAAWHDIRGLRIPNAVPLIIIAAFVMAFAASTLGGHYSGSAISLLLSHLASGVLVFAVTFLLYMRGLMGAGDTKLATAYALWVGISALPFLLFFTALAGGLLALVALVIKRLPKVPPAMRKNGWIFALRSGHNAIPYAVAIWLGAMAAIILAA